METGKRPKSRWESQRRGQTQQRGDLKRRERMGARTAKEGNHETLAGGPPKPGTDSMSYANRGSKKNHRSDFPGLSRSN
jgi:hypothetical protein